MADKQTVTYTPPRDASTPAQQQYRAEQEYWGPRFAARLAVDDAGRAVAPKVEMIALVGLTIVSGDAGNMAERVIQAGEPFEISEFDVSRYAGRARRKLLDLSTF